MGDESKTVSIGATLAQGVVLTVAVGFIVSVIYDWGFIYALGLDIAYLPTTTADHFRTGILWFPPLLGFTLVYIAIEFQFQRMERGLTENEIVKSSTNPERMQKFWAGPWKLVMWIAPLYALYYVLIGDTFAGLLPGILAILWIGFSRWCYSTPLVKLRRSKAIQTAFTFLPLVGILAFFSGYNAAVDAAVRKPFEITVERKEPFTSVSGNILRTLDKGVLLLNDGNSILFLPWDQVGAIRDKKPYKPFRGVLCEWFRLCSLTDTISNKPVQPTAGGGG